VKRAWISVDRFFFAPASAAPLAVLRVGVGALLAVQAALLAPAILELSGDEGFFQRAVRDGLIEPGTPRAGWLVSAFSHLGVGEGPVLHGIGAVYVLALLALTAGLATRPAAAVAWLTHLLLVTSMTSAVYGVDELAGIFLFYLVWLPSGEALSLDVRLGRASAEPSPSARLGLRVVQIHLSIVYLASGIHKALGHPWWNGEAVWRSLMLPEFNQLDFSSLAGHAWAARVAGWGVLLVEIGYPVLIWPRFTRRAWVAVVVALHLGIAVLMGLHVFGALMVVLTVAAFSVPADPAPVEEERPALGRRWSPWLLALLGAMAVLAGVLGVVSGAPADPVTVPVTELGILPPPHAD
jgi:Vitamin K-dependent gamma-carboxylase